MSEDFSVVVIAKNEEATIGKLLDSLQGVFDIVILDTGSTDKTVEIAKSYNTVKVIEAGDKFVEIANKSDVRTFRNRYGFAPTFEAGTRLFNYGVARNYAMSFATNDFCFFPDADEVVTWNLDLVRATLPIADRLSYRFAFSHDSNGNPLLQFNQTKFFRKSKYKWHKKVHEIEYPLNDKPLRTVYTDAIFHNHWQDKSDNRSNYLQKLEFSVLENPKDDRNHYYLAREYYYAWEYEQAISVFNKYLNLDGWKPERSQAMIYLGDCYKFSGRGPQAIEWYHTAILEDDSRREPWFALGNTYYEWAQYQKAIPYLRAATEIPLPAHYLNDMPLYTWKIWDLLSLAYAKLGNDDRGRECWLEAVKAAPEDKRILGNATWFFRRK